MAGNRNCSASASSGKAVCVAWTGGTELGAARAMKRRSAKDAARQATEASHAAQARSWGHGSCLIDLARLRDGPRQDHADSWVDDGWRHSDDSCPATGDGRRRPDDTGEAAVRFERSLAGAGSHDRRPAARRFLPGSRTEETHVASRRQDERQRDYVQTTAGDVLSGRVPRHVPDDERSRALWGGDERRRS